MLLSNEDPASLMELDRVIHEPARLVLVAVLAAVKKADFGFLLEETGLTRGNLSSHMSRLESEGYVEIEKTFVERKPRTTYSLTSEGRYAWREYRKRLRRLLA